MGEDKFGASMKENFLRNEVDVSHSLTTQSTSGIAPIVVDKSGSVCCFIIRTLMARENSIVVIPGANMDIKPSHLAEFFSEAVLAKTK